MCQRSKGLGSSAISPGGYDLVGEGEVRRGGLGTAWNIKSGHNTSRFSARPQSLLLGKATDAAGEKAGS